MRCFLFYLLPFLILTSCSDSQEKVLYPTKIVVGDTEYNFLYNPHKNNRIYSITTTRHKFYEAAEFTYLDEHLKEPDHPLKDYIYSINISPDKNTTG